MFTYIYFSMLSLHIPFLRSHLNDLWVIPLGNGDWRKGFIRASQRLLVGPQTPAGVSAEVRLKFCEYFGVKIGIGTKWWKKSSQTGPLVIHLWATFSTRGQDSLYSLKISIWSCPVRPTMNPNTLCKACLTVVAQNTLLNRRMSTAGINVFFLLYLTRLNSFHPDLSLKCNAKKSHSWIWLIFDHQEDICRLISFIFCYFIFCVNYKNLQAHQKTKHFWAHYGTQGNTRLL